MKADAELEDERTTADWPSPPSKPSVSRGWREDLPPNVRCDQSFSPVHELGEIPQDLDSAATLFLLTLRLRVGVFLPMVAVLAGVGVGCALGGSAAPKTTGTALSDRLAIGKALYRTYCGQCHALAAVDAAGFGSDNGLGEYGGPSFNDLRVPYNLAIVAVTEMFSPRGHAIAVKHMTWQQLSETASFLATATATAPYSARISNG